MITLSIILPTFNESQNIIQAIEEVRSACKGFEHEILVMDDDSPDKTWLIAQEYAQKEDPTRIRVIRRLHSKGLSAAVIDGFSAANGQVLMVMDADLQHDPAIIPMLVAEIVESGSDIAIGTRHADGGSSGNWSRWRKLVSWVATLLARLFLSVQVSDPMSGFFCLHRRHFEILAPRIDPKGFKILLEFLARDRQLKVSEVGYSFRTRQFGESKLSSAVIVQYILALYSLSLGSFVPIEFLKYALVGMTGVGVNQLVTWSGINLLSLSTSSALILGIEISLLSNFFLNNAWTFQKVQKVGIRAVSSALLRFHLICLAGALINYSICIVLNSDFGWNLYVANLVAIGLATIWNFLINRQFTWKNP